MPLTLCRCCQGTTQFFSMATILDFKATYSLCQKCSSVQVESPDWLEKAHSKAISILDTGLVSRCVSASRLVATLLFLEGKNQATGIDWGGGTGLLTRLLRDQGFQALSFDKYSEGVHSEGFEASEQDASNPATFITSIEWFEHLINPIESFNYVTSNKEYFIFTTEIITTPPPDPASRSWWYFVPESGQHVTFASKRGLIEFCKILNFSNYVQFGSLHVMSRTRLKLRTRMILGTRLLRGIAFLVIPELLNRRHSLAIQDKSRLIGES